MNNSKEKKKVILVGGGSAENQAAIETLKEVADVVVIDPSESQVSLEDELSLKEIEMVMTTNQRPSLLDRMAVAAQTYSAFTPRSKKRKHIMRTVEVRTKKKVKRNEPCPCGSEKKFKKCCLNKKQ